MTIDIALPSSKKMTLVIRSSVFLLIIFFSFTHLIVSAEESLATARQLSEAGHILPLEKIITSAKIIKPGEFLEIELEHKKNGYVYEVEMLDHHGQVWELKFNAKTGKLIDIELDD